MTKDPYRGFVESDAEELGLTVTVKGGMIYLYYGSHLLVKKRGYYWVNRYMVEHRREVRTWINMKRFENTDQRDCKHESLELTCMNRLGVIYWMDPAVDDNWGEETFTDGYFALHGECRDCGKKFSKAELHIMGIEVQKWDYDFIAMRITEFEFWRKENGHEGLFSMPLLEKFMDHLRNEWEKTIEETRNRMKENEDDEQQ